MMIERAAVKVLYVVDEFPDPNSGTEGQFWKLITDIDRAIVDPSIMLLRRSAYIEQHACGIPIRALNVQRLRNPRTWWRALQAVRWAKGNGHEVAHIFLNDSSMLFPPLLKAFGIKVIVSRRDLGFWYSPTKLRLLRMVRHFVDLVVANCEAVRRVVIREEHYRPDSVTVIYNGIPTSGALTVSAPMTRRDFKIPESSPLIVLVANLRPLKRIEDAIDALTWLDDARFEPPHLLIVGEDRPCASAASYRTELENLATRRGVADRVHFAGKMPDPRPAVSLADVGVLCSETEGLSNVLIEYLMAGKPVVCTDVGGNREIVLEGVSGYVVPAGDASALADAIGDLLADPEKRKHLGTAGQASAVDRFGYRRMLSEHTRVYLALARGTVVQRY